MLKKLNIVQKGGEDKTMISEEELTKLSYPEAPKIITAKVPGPKGQKIYDMSLKFQTPTRVGGMGLPFVWEEARGATAKDPDGNIVINMTGGIAVNNVGQCHPKVVAAIREQAGKVMHTIDMVSVVNQELSERLSGIMPKGLRGNCVTAYAASGSGAVETAVKYARFITKKTQIVAFHGSYHGVWGWSNAMTCGDHYREGWGPLAPYIIHAPYPYYYRWPIKVASEAECGEEAADYLDYLLNSPYTGAHDVAAVFVEPIEGEGGYVIPPAGFLKRVQESCRKNGCLFVVDEVQAGFGRTGKMWSCEWDDVEPDMLVWGKGVGGDQPITGVTLRRDLAEKLQPLTQPLTFTANGVSCAAALANIDIMTDENDDLMGRASIVGEEIVKKLRDAAEKSKNIGEVRGRGFMIGVELVEDKKTKEPVPAMAVVKLMWMMRDRGVLAFPCGRYTNVMRFMPALVCTREHFDKSVDIFLDILESQTWRQS